MLPLVLAAPVLAQEQGGETAAWTEASLDVGTRYVWRGMRLSDGLVSQAAVDAGAGGLEAGIWSNYDPREYPFGSGSRRRITETDLTVAYGGRWGRGTLKGGLIYYGLRDAPDTSEVFASYEFAVPFQPSVTLYVDVDEGDGGFVLLAAGHSLALGEGVALDLGVEAGVNLEDKVMGADESGRPFAGLYHGEISAGTSIPIRRGLALASRLAASFPFTRRAGDAIAAGSYDGRTRASVHASVGIAAAF